MKCSDNEELLSPFLDQELDRNEERVVREHLKGCARCRQELASLQQTAHLIRSLEDVALPADFPIQLRNRLHTLSLEGGGGEIKANFRRWPRVFRSHWLSLGVAAVLLIALATIYNPFVFSQTQSDLSSSQMLTQKAPPVPETPQQNEEKELPPAANTEIPMEKEKAENTLTERSNGSRSTARGITVTSKSSEREKQAIEEYKLVLTTGEYEKACTQVLGLEEFFGVNRAVVSQQEEEPGKETLFVLKISKDSYSQVINEISQWGSITEESYSENDVSSELDSLKSQLTKLQGAAAEGQEKDEVSNLTRQMDQLLQKIKYVKVNLQVKNTSR